MKFYRASEVKNLCKRIQHSRAPLLCLAGLLFGAPVKNGIGFCHISRRSLARALFLWLALFSSNCHHPTEVIDKSHEFQVILESDLDHAVVKRDGTVWAWGENTTGQLGNGTMTRSEKPAQVLRLKHIVALDLCEGAAGAADADGNIWFWGNRLIWEEPPGFDTTILIPQKIAFLPGVRQLQWGGTYLYLLKLDGTVWRATWDHNSPTKRMHPEEIPKVKDVQMLSGYLALKSNGMLCPLPDCDWVGLQDGGLGNEIILGVQALQNVYLRYTLILKNDGTVWSWGRNLAGSLGNGTFDDSVSPSKIDTLHEAVSVSANASRCLALKKDGTVWFWGSGRCQPMKIVGLSDVEVIHASPVGGLLFLKKDGTYWSCDIQTQLVAQLEL